MVYTDFMLHEPKFYQPFSTFMMFLSITFRVDCTYSNLSFRRVNFCSSMQEFMGRNLLALNVMWKYMEQVSCFLFINYSRLFCNYMRFVFWWKWLVTFDALMYPYTDKKHYFLGVSFKYHVLIWLEPLSQLHFATIVSGNIALKEVICMPI